MGCAESSLIRGMRAFVRFAPWALLLLLGGCSNDPTGTYKGSFADGSQATIIIRPDGSYEQSAVQDSQVLYMNKGTWSLKGNQLVFKDFITAFDLPRSVGGKTTFCGTSTICWGWPESDLLTFSEADNYVLRLTSKSVPPPQEIDEATVQQYRHKFSKKELRSGVSGTGR